MSGFKRRIFLINKRFQFRFAFYVCSWLIALSFAYVMVISTLFDYFIRYVAADPMGPAIAGLEKTRSDLLWLLVLMQGILIILTFLVSIFMSHKIAGPLYRLRKFFQEARTGNIEQRLRFRKGDYFPELAEDYNGMMEGVMTRVLKTRELAQAAIPRIEKAIILSSLPEAKSLQEAKNELDAALAALQEIEKN